ncbi:MAG: glycosyltransferase family 39 protein [Verrucomicrobia bacterium]|nr:glycosyltransferase family 39 protein [Verrucomicrobiota bacterium]
MKSSGSRVTSTAWLLAAIIIVAAVARLAFLDLSAFRADSIDLYRQALSKTPALEIWKNPPWSNQIPLAEVITLGFHHLLGIEATHFTVRLPFALMGILAVLGVYFLGRRVQGPELGLVASSIAALNTFHLHVSREAYHYSGVTLFSTLTLVAFWGLLSSLDKRRNPPLRDWILWLVFGVLQCHTHMSAWMSFGGQGLFLGYMILRKGTEDPRDRKRLLIYLVVVAAIVFAFLLPHMKRAFAEYLPTAAKKYSDQAGNWSVILKAIVQFIPAYTFGTWWLALVLEAVLVAGVVWVFFAKQEERHTIRLFGTLFAVEFVILTLTMAIIGKGRANFNYFSSLWPFVMLFMALCVKGVGHFISQRFRLKEGFAVTLVLLPVIAYSIPPAWWTARSTGKPKPYKEIVKACDEHLPAGTPVLVDRWFEPWNELRVYNSSRVFFTFTVPDEPLEAYVKNQWRKTAKEFFRNNPTGAYLELRKTNWQNPDIGPWLWPREYFKNHVQIINQAGIHLQNWGLNFRPGTKMNINGEIYWNNLVVDLFYNTREDSIEQARKEGRPFIVFYGPEWHYTKLWPQIQDFRDWRVMEERGTIELFNLQDKPAYVRFGLRGMAIQGRKKVQIGDQLSHSFPDRELSDWMIGLTEISPGSNRLQLEDKLWSLGRVPLLLEQVIVEPATEEDIRQIPDSTAVEAGGR